MISSLYIHIPFCLQKCDYCDFFSKPHSGKIPDAYVEAIINEAEFYACKYGINCWKTIYFGGGTPGILSARQISFILEKFSSRITSETSEITMEMNPESVTKDKLLAAQTSGITRLSLGIQSLNDRALKSVNRHCSSTKAKESLKLIKEIWKGQLNLDAIAGLPEQSQDEFLSSLKEIISYNPDHISMYTLTIEEGTPLHKKIEDKKVEFNFDEADEQWLKGRELLESSGYLQYEVSNFSKPKKESRHNLTYWMQEDYVGVGAGASGTIYGNETIRWSNTRDIEKHTAFWTNEKNHDLKNAPRELENINLETREFEFIMMGLRTTRGINSARYEKLFSDVSPWNGNLSLRLGKNNGIWNKFSMGKLTSEKKESDGSTTFSLNSQGLIFLNKFLIELL